MIENPESPLRDRLPGAADASHDARTHAAARQAFLNAHREGPPSVLAMVQMHGVPAVFVGVAVLTVLWATMTAGGVSAL
jgi:hypothetical protein